MSIWTSIRDKVVSPLITLGATAVGSFLGGPVGGAVAGGVVGAATGRSSNTAPPTTAGSQAGGVVQTLPALRQGGGVTMGVGGGTPPTMLTQLAAGAGSMARNYLTGTVLGPMGRKMSVGKITGNAIPRGYIEKMSPAGVVYLGKRSRRRGITSRDLSSFRRVQRLIARYSKPHTTHRRGK